MMWLNRNVATIIATFQLLDIYRYRCIDFLLQADADKDGCLTLAEMIDNPYVFYSAILNDDEEIGRAHV